jgi:hypothetical protein
MVVLPLVHVPPVVGVSCVVEPIQILVSPLMPTGTPFTTLMATVLSDLHPVADSSNTNVTDPTPVPVTTPLLVMVAIAGLLLVQLPPDDGIKLVVPLMQISLSPFKAVTGLLFTIMEMEPFEDGQPVLVFTKLKLVIPADKAMTLPLLFIEAIDGLVEVQTPPVEGNK